MKENARRIVLYYAPTHFHKKSSCFFRSEKSLKSNDVLCASRFRDDKKNIQKQTLGVTGPMKTNIKWSSGWLVWDDFQVELYRNTKIVIWEAVFCTKYNGILQNQCNPVSISLATIPFEAFVMTFFDSGLLDAASIHRFSIYFIYVLKLV